MKPMLFELPKKAALSLIRLYQNTLSLDHGPLHRFTNQPRCKFHPTCSEYSHQSIERFGVLRGAFLSIKRILRCHPWSLGGIDPIPTSFQISKKV
jgi:putative membrane protein insertion efficiency factor